MSLPQKESYTFSDLLALTEQERYELLDGELFMMSPPGRIHQKILMELAFQLRAYLSDKQCEAYPAPFAVRLFADTQTTDEETDTVVEPDISVICDLSKLDDKGCKGAPDFIIEILSPSTIRRDRLEKLRLYQKAGVKEYWIVNPEEKSVIALTLDQSGQYLLRSFYDRTDSAKVQTLKNCEIDLARVFA